MSTAERSSKRSSAFVAAAAPSARGAEVAVEAVSKRYGAAVQALTGVTLRIAPGELVVVGGPSGSGKSTLLQIVAGFTRPDSGSVAVDGQDVADLRRPAAYRRHVVGVVFQSHHLLPALDARMNVEVALLESPFCSSPRVCSSRVSRTYRRSASCVCAGSRPRPRSAGPRSEWTRAVTTVRHSWQWPRRTSGLPCGPSRVRIPSAAWLVGSASCRSTIGRSY